MEKNISNLKAAVIVIAVVLSAFVILNVFYLSQIKNSVELFSREAQSASNKYYELKEELSAEKTKMSMMAHVLDIKHILDMFKTRTDSYNTMDFALLIATESFENNLDPLLVLAVIMTESSFRKSVVSHKGAIGLMQILPNTAHYVSDMHDHIELASTQELFEPDTNIKIGINYLSYLIEKFDNQKYAIMAYNMGPTNLIRRMRSGAGLPERYYRSVMSNYEQILSISGRA